MERVTQGTPFYSINLLSSLLQALPQSCFGLERIDAITTDIGEPDFIVHPTMIPNDPNFKRQMGLTDSASGCNAVGAWDIQTDASSVIVAVIDSGIRYTHEDLVGNIWNNPAPTESDYHGWNASDTNGDPMDVFGHGTHCAGTIGAVGNNGIGIAGVCWKVQLMGCRFMDANGSGVVSDAIICIDYACHHGATILNCSWGFYTYSQALFDELDYARSQGVIIVAAAGNDAKNNDDTPLYPASYELDNMVSVAALDCCDGDLTDFSNYGKTTVHLAAPGDSIYSTWGGGSNLPGFQISGTGDSAYAIASGTSMAAPFVVGALALLKVQHPDYSYTELRSALFLAADQSLRLQGQTIYGKLNIGTALSEACPGTF